MAIIKILLLVIEGVCAVLLVGVILLQKSKSEGLGMAFGSGMGETLFGSRAGNVLTRITITLGVTFLITTTLLAVMTSSSTERSLIDERVADVPMQQQAAPASPTALSSLPPAGPDAAPAAPMAMDTGAPVVPEPVVAEPAAEPAPAVTP